MKEYGTILAVLRDLKKFAELNDLDRMKLAIDAACETAVSEIAAISTQKDNSQCQAPIDFH